MQKLIKQDIIYFTQRNNKKDPMRACFPTSMAMAMRNNGYIYSKVQPPGEKEALELDDYLMWYANSNQGRTIATSLGIPIGTKWLNEWWSVMERVGNALLNKQGMSCKWTTMNVAQIKAQIDKGKMVVIGTMFTGSGHIVTVSGYDGDKLIVCDPYGNPNTSYSNKEGKNIVLDSNRMTRLRKNVIIFS